MKTRDIKTISVNCKEWFDKVNGNSYFAGEVIINAGKKNEKQIIMPFQYGYGDFFRYKAFETIKKELNCFKKLDERTSYWRAYEQYKIKATHSIKTNCLKRELLNYQIMRTQTDYNKIVNYDKETNEVIVLDYIFDDTLHGKSFKGATGTTFEPISKEDVQEAIEPSNILNYLAENQIGLNCKFTELSEDDFINVMYDTSHRELWDYMRKELNLDEDEAYIFRFTGGGRCFDKDFQGNVNPELSILIREIES